MKKKYFYSHLVSIEILGNELEGLNLSPAEKVELMELADKNIHHEVMDVILSQLDGEDRNKFLELLVADEHEKIWEHLNDKTNDIERRIKQAADQIRKELTEDVKKLKPK